MARIPLHSIQLQDSMRIGPFQGLQLVHLQKICNKDVYIQIKFQGKHTQDYINTKHNNNKKPMMGNQVSDFLVTIVSKDHHSIMFQTHSHLNLFTFLNRTKELRLPSTHEFSKIEKAETFPQIGSRELTNKCIMVIL